MKKVIFINREYAERITPKKGEKAAIISINSNGDLAKLHENWEHKLFLVFHDLDKPIKDYKIFDKEQAKQIIKFVDKVANDILILVVHCDAGVSRSAAVAKFVAEKYGLLFPDNYTIYNKLVYSTLKYVDNGEIVLCTAEDVKKHNKKIKFT
jgi:predicted protein tyrosine phosphatase